MESQTHVALIHFELHFPDVHSLKEKRMHLRPIKDGLSGKFNVSVAEVGFNELWQRSVLAVALVSNARSSVERQAAQVIAEVEQTAPSELVRHNVEYW